MTTAIGSNIGKSLPRLEARDKVTGRAEYTHHLNPTDSLTPGQKRYAEQQLALFKTWYRQWSAA